MFEHVEARDHVKRFATELRQRICDIQFTRIAMARGQLDTLGVHIRAPGRKTGFAGQGQTLPPATTIIQERLALRIAMFEQQRQPAHFPKGFVIMKPVGVFVDFVGEVTDFHQRISSTPKRARLPGIDPLEVSVPHRRPRVGAAAGPRRPTSRNHRQPPQTLLIVFQQAHQNQTTFRTYFPAQCASEKSRNKAKHALDWIADERTPART